MLEKTIRMEIDLAHAELSGRKAISIFGGARLSPDSNYYGDCVEVAKRIASKGFSVLAGAGPGVMQAAAQGAHQIDPTQAVGLSISLPFEAKANDFVGLEIPFNYFASRKIAFTRNVEGFVVFPGGYGTLDELFEVANLMITGKSPIKPIVLYGINFWEPAIAWFKKSMLSNGLINEKDLSLLSLVNTPSQALDALGLTENKINFDPISEKIYLEENPNELKKFFDGQEFHYL